MKLQAETSHPSRGVDWKEIDVAIASAPVIGLDRLPMHLISDIGNLHLWHDAIILVFPFADRETRHSWTTLRMVESEPERMLVEPSDTRAMLNR